VAASPDKFYFALVADTHIIDNYYVKGNENGVGGNESILITTSRFTSARDLISSLNLFKRWYPVGKISERNKTLSSERSLSIFKGPAFANGTRAYFCVVHARTMEEIGVRRTRLKNGYDDTGFFHLVPETMSKGENKCFRCSINGLSRRHHLARN
jgi:hypothetical protein